MQQNLLSFKLVRIPDNMNCWKEEIAKAAKQINSVYMYNPKEHTHCCEIKPSYFMIPVYFDYEAERDLIDTAIDEKIMEGWHSGTDECYMHVSYIDKLKSSKTFKFETEEDAREYFQGNHVY